MKWLLHVLQRLWTSPAVAGCRRWLTWGSDKEAGGADVSRQDTDVRWVFTILVGCYADCWCKYFFFFYLKNKGHLKNPFMLNFLTDLTLHPFCL